MVVNNDHLPNASTQFVIEGILKSGKVIEGSQLKIGSTITLMLKADKALHKRIITIRDFDGEVNFMQATGHAILFGFMGDLLKWYKENKNWNEGGYTT
jgi:hypothetical protein